MELRERMAKMSGGMGMMGFFGPPGGMSVPGAGPRKPKATAETEKKTEDSDRAAPATAPPVPVMALPGMNAVRPTAASPSVEKEEDVPHPASVTEQHPPQEIPDVEDVVQEDPSRGAPDERPAAPQGTHPCFSCGQ
jgi:hypothetical protein